MRESAKPTPGPWEAQTHIANESINRVMPVFARRNMGRLPACEGGGYFIRNQADAHLIAAAPDYHERAYHLAMYVLQSSAYRDDAEFKQLVDDVLAIHAKAEGRS
jgi:hypothetical protein